MRVGDVLVRGRPDLVEELLEVLPDGRYHCRALYLGKRFSTDAVHWDLADARLATPEDHEQAKAYAEKHEARLSDD